MRSVSPITYVNRIPSSESFVNIFGIFSVRPNF